jgi:hypothetical protein
MFNTIKLLVSFSGGRTSAYMLWWILNKWEHRHEYEIIVVFANTGKEQEGTLEFVERCSKEWGVKVIWVEAIPVESKRGKWWGVKHKIVDFKTAARKGEPFEAVISKLGIPSTEAPFCSDQLKRKPIESYLKSIGWKDYYKAIGIRVDEIDRLDENFREKKILYILVKDNPTMKRTILNWWTNHHFNLSIDPDLGNCDGCWKKDINRLVRIGKKTPTVFDWWQEMTDKYGHIKNRPGQANMRPPFNFYRGNISPKEILQMAALSKRQLNMFAEAERLNGCSESCEPTW